MRRTMVIFQILFFALAMAGIAGASVQYQPVMSKDDKLCNTVLSELNHDMARYGEIRFNGHEATPVIEWRPISELDRQFGDGECQRYRWAKFDLNNDRQIDFVVKHSMCWEEAGWEGMKDSLWAFKGKYAGYRSAKTSEDVLGGYSKAGIAVLNFSGYYLSDIPRSYEDLRVEERVEGPLVVSPFLYQGVAYMHLDSIVPNVRSITAHIVAKYVREVLPPPNVKKTPDILLPNGRYKGLEDVCYFMAEVPERKPLERLEDGYVLRP